MCAWEIVIDDDSEPCVYPDVQEPLLADVLRNFPYDRVTMGEKGDIMYLICFKNYF